jgi:hypothetical protein
MEQHRRLMIAQILTMLARRSAEAEDGIVPPRRQENEALRKREYLTVPRSSIDADKRLRICFWLGLIMGMSAIVGAVLCVRMGQPWVAGIILSVPVMVATAFINQDTEKD